VLDWSGDIFKHFYGPLFPEWADKAADAKDPKKLLELMDKTGLFQYATASKVRDFYVEQWKQLPAEYIIIVSHYAQTPKQDLIDNVKIFMEEVKPALDELTDLSG